MTSLGRIRLPKNCAAVDFVAPPDRANIGASMLTNKIPEQQEGPMFWKSTKRPDPPLADQERPFVEWLLRHGKDFEIYRRIYRRDVDNYVRINLDAVMKELANHPTKESLSARLGAISLLYAEEFMPLVEKSGGLPFCEPKLQAYAAMIQIKANALHYILKYKHKDKLTIAQETVTGPLEDIYSEKT